MAAIGARLLGSDRSAATPQNAEILFAERTVVLAVAPGRAHAGAGRYPPPSAIRHGMRTRTTVTSSSNRSAVQTQEEISKCRRR
jgi:hypothetical protein